MKKRSELSRKERAFIMANAFRYIFNIKRKSGESETESKGNHSFIPYDNSRLVDALNDALEYTYERIGSESNESRSSRHKISFVDAGCGCGNVMALMSSICLSKMYTTNRYINNEMVDYTITGIDLVEKNIEIARTILSKSRWVTHREKHHPKNVLIHGDIMECEEIYKKADIIYYYRPIANIQKQREFEKLLSNTCKVGGLIIGIFSTQGCPIGSDNRFETLNKYEGEPVWVKKGE